MPLNVHSTYVRGRFHASPSRLIALAHSRNRFAVHTKTQTPAQGTMHSGPAVHLTGSQRPSILAVPFVSRPPAVMKSPRSCTREHESLPSYCSTFASSLLYTISSAAGASSGDANDDLPRFDDIMQIQRVYDVIWLYRQDFGGSPREVPHIDAGRF